MEVVIIAQREKLTEKLVRAAEPRAGIYQVFDEDVRGFSLRIFSEYSTALAHLFHEHVASHSMTCGHPREVICEAIYS
jgi:hypothetical protein